MQGRVLWTDVMPERDGKTAAVRDVDISPDGAHVVAAVGDRVLVYNAANGELIHSLRGHNGLVNSVSFGFDGTHFASGGEDGGVLWEIGGRGVIRYKLQAPVQKVVYNPITHLILSCADGQFGLCTLETKQVSKHKISGKVVSTAWSPDGALMALGMTNGHISVRNRDAEEIVRIERSSPVVSLCFTTARDGHSHVLVAATWDKLLCMYNTMGEQIIKDRKLTFFPRSVAAVGSKQQLLAAIGSDQHIQFFTNSGVRLSTIPGQPGWMICSAAAQDKLAIGTERGVLQYMAVEFNPVFTLHKQRYAYCENLTDVVIVNLMTTERVCIKCRDLVGGLAIYNNRLAVRLSGRIHIYEVSSPDDVKDMRYRVKEKLRFETPDCRMLLTARHLLLICRNVVQAYTGNKRLEREWTFPADVTAHVVVDGPNGAEMLLFGLSDGSVHQVFAVNAFAMQLVDPPSSKAAVQAMHMSLYRDMLACVYSDARLVVYNVRAGSTTLFQDSAATSVCFNSEVNSMLCYTSHDRLLVLPSMGLQSSEQHDVQPIQQRSAGKALGFYASKVLIICHDSQLSWLDIPQDGPLTSYIDNADLASASTVASLGATPAEWRRLGMAALRLGNMHVAKKAFARLQDAKLLHTIDRLGSNTTTVSDGVRLQAELLALQGLITDAAKTFSRANRIQEAVNVFVDMKKWDEARAFAANAPNADVSELTTKQAEWCETIGDWKQAATIFANAKRYQRAVQLIANRSADGWQAAIAELVELIPNGEAEVLRECGSLLLSSGDDEHSRIVFQKLGDYEQLLNLYVRKNNWEEAVRLVTAQPELDKRLVYAPFGTWLLTQDKFEEALDAYRQAGQFRTVLQVLQILTKNAIIECRFKDAAWGYFELSNAVQQLLDTSEITGEERSLLMEQRASYDHCADVYYAYSHIYASTTDPFTSLQPDVLLQVATFLLNNLRPGTTPRGVSRANILYTLARQAMTLHAYNLARSAFAELQHLQLKQRWTEFIDSDMLVIQSKPMTDDPELLPVCYRCSHRNPLLNSLANRPERGDFCKNCGHPFVRSFINFEILPLVEFVADPTISDDEALELIQQAPPCRSRNAMFRTSKWREQQTSEADLLLLNEVNTTATAEADAAIGDEDSFARCVSATLLQQTNGTSYLPVKLDRSALKNLDRQNVFAYRSGSRLVFYHNVLPEASVAVSQPARRFFQLEDFEFAYLSEGRCPFSRVKNVGDYSSL